MSMGRGWELNNGEVWTVKSGRQCFREDIKLLKSRLVINILRPGHWLFFWKIILQCGSVWFFKKIFFFIKINCSKNPWQKIVYSFSKEMLIRRIFWFLSKRNGKWTKKTRSRVISKVFLENSKMYQILFCFELKAALNNHWKTGIACFQFCIFRLVFLEFLTITQRLLH